MRGCIRCANPIRQHHRRGDDCRRCGYFVAPQRALWSCRVGRDLSLCFGFSGCRGSTRRRTISGSEFPFTSACWRDWAWNSLHSREERWCLEHWQVPRDRPPRRAAHAWPDWPRTFLVIRSIVGLCSIDFGLNHLLDIKDNLIYVPKWMPPGQQFWVIATGLGFVLAGLALLTGIQDLLAGRLLALMFSLSTCSRCRSLFSPIRRTMPRGAATRSISPWSPRTGSSPMRS